MKLIKNDKKKKADEPRPNLTERIYQQIKQDIFTFRLLPGDRFSENEIAERVEASRTPVREALTRLQREGFVDVSFRTEHVSDDGKTALLRAIFYSPKLNDRVHKDPTYEIAFTVLFSGAFVGLAHLYHRLIRSPLGHREWLNHTEK